MQVFKTKWFARYARRGRIKDQTLVDAIERAGRGLIDADLSGGLIKQRIARPGQGRSGGFRTIIAYKAKDRAVFLYGFAKNELDNIDDDQLATFRELAAAWLVADETKLEGMVKQGLAEVIDYEQDAKKD